MATGTLDSQSEEQLGNVFHLFVRLIDFPVPCDRWIVIGISRRRQDFANELIVGLVLVKA